MTDKIIIDSVDVSGCEFAESYILDNKIQIICKYSKNRGEFIYGCGNNPNCYYKQLARKTEECEKKCWEIGNLGYKIKNQRKEINERLKQLQAEKQKVTELEEKYKWYDHYRDSALYNKDLCNKKSDEIEKYKQALEEIKYITTELYLGVKDNDRPYCEKILEKCEVLDKEQTNVFNRERT